MFLGTHTPRLDDKGRLALPAKFRSELEGGLVISKGQDRCLFVFPIAEFNRLTDLLRTAPVTDRRVRDYSRVLFASASHEMPGRAGPDHGAAAAARATPGCRRTAWSSAPTPGSRCGTRSAWQEYLDNTEQAFADAAEEVLPGLSVSAPL